jgi:hypothetical protein
VRFAILAFLVAGCGSGVAPATPSFDSSSVIAVPTQEPVPDGNTPPPCPAALVRGQLVPSPDWGVARADEEGGLTRQVIWPFGYVAEVQAERLALRSRTGTVVAITGDRLQLGGGGVGRKALGSHAVILRSSARAKAACRP